MMGRQAGKTKNLVSAVKALISGHQDYRNLSMAAPPAAPAKGAITFPYPNGTTISLTGDVNWAHPVVGQELPGRLFPYLGAVIWNNHGSESYCKKCNIEVPIATVVAEGKLWEFCPKCHTVLWVGINSNV